VQKRLVIITSVNDDEKLLEFDIKLDVSRHFNIKSVNESLKTNLTLYFMVMKFMFQNTSLVIGDLTLKSLTPCVIGA
jgi:hypothetical protein